MRIAFLILVAALSGCNSSDDDSSLQQQISAIPNEATAVQAMRAQISDLQGKISKINELTLIGKPTSIANSQGTSPNDFRTMGEITQAATPISFGPCSDMGVLIGFTNGNGQPADALTAFGQAFRQCTGYQYETVVSTGAIALGERIFWDGPNCTGNLIEWEAAGAAFNTSSLKNGVVFTNPFDGQTVLMIKAGQTPQQILIQSVWVRENPGCQSDVEIQPMYQVTPNDVTVSGIPSNGVGAFQLASP